MDLNDLPKWEYKIPSGNTTNDDTERPPLTGKTVYVPKGLYEQPWNEIHDAYGAATLTPYYIEALASLDEGDQQFGAYGLYAATTHQGSVYESSKMAIPFLIDMLNAEKDYGFIIASHFISRIAVGENHFIRTPKDIEASKSIYFNDVFTHLEQLKVFYKETNSEEIERLLCFYPNILPDYLDLNIDNPERLASALVTQGFIAAERGRIEHKSTVQKLMYNSPSLLVRGAAAICLSYSNMATDDVFQLLEYLATQNFRYTPWVWDSLSDIASSAWLYAADMETLLSRKACVQDYEPLSKLKCLHEAFFRVFKPRYHPYLPADLSPIQKRVLEEFADYKPNSLHQFEFNGYNVPENPFSLKRLLGKSNELLCKKISIEYDTLEGFPLWYLLESYLLPDSHISEEMIARALASVDTWTVAKEIFYCKPDSKGAENCTLSLHAHFGDGVKNKKIAKLISALANALYNESILIKTFLDEWLEKTKNFEGYDWAFKTPAERIGIALLVLGRNGTLSPEYYPLVRHYHQYVEHSALPLQILAELLGYTSTEHQQLICGELCLYNIYDENEEDENDIDWKEENSLYKLISKIDYSWSLLKGCNGEWVIDKIRDAANAWHNINEEYLDKVVGDAFPYADAVEILKNQNNIDYQLLNSLPRF